MIPKRFLGTPKIVVTESGQSAQANVRLVYNPNNTGSAPAFRDFSSALEGGELNFLRAYDLSTPASDIWTPDNTYGPSSVSVSNGQFDLTYRSTGQKLVVWQTGSGTLYLTSNQGYITPLYGDISLGDVGHPRITTNAFNRRDPVILWNDNYDLEGDGSPISTLFFRELYP